MGPLDCIFSNSIQFSFICFHLSHNTKRIIYNDKNVYIHDKYERCGCQQKYNAIIYFDMIMIIWKKKRRAMKILKNPTNMMVVVIFTLPYRKLLSNYRIAVCDWNYDTITIRGSMRPLSLLNRVNEIITKMSLCDLDLSLTQKYIL